MPAIIPGRLSTGVSGSTAQQAADAINHLRDLVAQVAVWQDREVCAFTKPGDVEGQAFALSLGCVWAGDSTQP